MRILLITSEEWNDYVYGNGVLTNWFTGFDAEFAQIYTSPGLPINNICERYFQITDSQMAKSIIGGAKAGKVIHKQAQIIESTKSNAKRKGIYGFMKKLTRWCRIPIVALQDAIWTFGRYNTNALAKFVADFNPDVVYCPRKASPKQIRLERIVRTMTNAPFIAFTADDEASYQQYDWSPLFWLHRWAMHHLFNKHVPGFYAHYWTFSEEQAADYTHQFGVHASTLYKCGDFPDHFIPRQVNTPIRLMYAGRIYCNRWKSLAAIGDALKVINRDDVKMELHVYTADELTSAQKKALSKERFIYLRGAVTPAQLIEEYAKADIALHVESLDKQNRLLTRVSFSTKIIDLMATGCAILALCWNRHAGYQYLQKNDAAFCVDNYADLLPMLSKIAANPALIQQYAHKAYTCGKQNHSRTAIQSQIRLLFQSAITNNNAQ